MALISVIVPTVAGRKADLERCLTAYHERSQADLELIVIEGKPTCGEAWVEGGRRATGDYLHFTADDLEPLAGWDEAAMAVCNAGEIPAANVTNPDGTQLRCYVPMEDDESWMDGTAPLNVLVPFLSRAQWRRGYWTLPIHYGTDDWVTFVALYHGIGLQFQPDYRFKHHESQPGRKNSRPEDVPQLVAAMAELWYAPPFYAKLARHFLTTGR